MTYTQLLNTALELLDEQGPQQALYQNFLYVMVCIFFRYNFICLVFIFNLHFVKPIHQNIVKYLTALPVQAIYNPLKFIVTFKYAL